ncbi:MAG: c-type cytochrome [Sphingomonadaceae bacterium]|jgi:cytochrome c2|nr:c-type cytochrome [Sphingomonadaceae bacterium]
MKKLIFASATLVLLSGCGSSSDVAEQPVTEQSIAVDSQDAVEVAAAPVVATPPAFAQCRSCHTVDKGGKNGIGPNLWGVFGKSAGQHAGFNYSPALKSSGRTWDRETLDAFLSSPMKTIPGTRMAFPGISNDAKRGEVIDFLETLAD